MELLPPSFPDKKNVYAPVGTQDEGDQYVCHVERDRGNESRAI